MSALHTIKQIPLGKNTSRDWGHTDPWPEAACIARVHDVRLASPAGDAYVVTLRHPQRARRLQLLVPANVMEEQGIREGLYVLVNIKHAVQEVVSLIPDPDGVRV